MATACDIDLGPPPHPTDRERELALELGQKISYTCATQPAFLTVLARALASYRVELQQETGARETAYTLVENELRDRRVTTIDLLGGAFGVQRQQGAGGFSGARARTLREALDASE